MCGRLASPCRCAAWPTATPLGLCCMPSTSRKMCLHRCPLPPKQQSSSSKTPAAATYQVSKLALGSNEPADERMRHAVHEGRRPCGERRGAGQGPKCIISPGQRSGIWRLRHQQPTQCIRTAQQDLRPCCPTAIVAPAHQAGTAGPMPSNRDPAANRDPGANPPGMYCEASVTLTALRANSMSMHQDHWAQVCGLEGAGTRRRGALRETAE